MTRPTTQPTTQPTAGSTSGAAIPILPARDLDETEAFYARVGFTTRFRDPRIDAHYLIVERDGVELHFFTHAELDPWTSSAGCYWRVTDADAWHQACAALAIPEQGIPRLTRPENRPWGMREFALVDPNGTLVRVGHVLAPTG